MHSRDAAQGRLGIWGFGLEGRAALTALRKSFKSVVVVDEYLESREESLGENVSVYFGPDHLDRLRTCDFVVVSPGVPSTHPYLIELNRQGVSMASGSALWLKSNWQGTIGVTGTKGKSTTASLINHLLRCAGVDSTLAGNIGTPLVDVPQDDGPVVAELSSYQCWWITQSPRLAVVTNLFEEHLGWHGNLQEYWRSKARIATCGAELLVCDSDTREKLATVDSAVTQIPTLIIQSSGPDIVAHNGTAVLSVAELPASLRSDHLVSSVRAAVLAVTATIGTERLSPALKNGLRDFQQLSSRLEIVSSHNGVTWVDDALSTTPQSVIAALRTFNSGHVVLIVGGQDRGISYAPLNDFLLQERRTPIDVIAMPTNGTHAVATFRKAHPDKVHEVASLSEAVTLASKIARPGGHVVLSPGAPSYDLYKNYKEKSAEFRQAIQKLEHAS